MYAQADVEKKTEPVAPPAAPIAEEPEAEAAAAEVIVTILGSVLYLIYQLFHRPPNFIMS
jgi:hypothetical protein